MEHLDIRSATVRGKLSPARFVGSRPFRRHLALFFATVLIGLSAVLAINAAVDPLWYWRGNIVTGENFAFNERFAKLNQFLRAPESYDCLIFGSSRATLLDQTQIENYRCANLAFSAGVVSEFVAVARYLKAQGFSPKLVIVGVDAFNFWRDMEPTLPDFVKRGQPPPGWISTYLSMSALSFSLRTLVDDSPFPRIYDKNLIGRVDEDAPTYVPPRLGNMVVKPREFDVSRQEYYIELRAIFPHARYVGYVPPISAWNTAEDLYLTGHIDEYLVAMKAIAGRFDALYDLSVPSEITMDPDYTYDGDHYRAAVNAVVADILQGQSHRFGIEIRGVTLAQYTRIYDDAFKGFLRSIRLDNLGGDG